MTLTAMQEEIWAPGHPTGDGRVFVWSLEGETVRRAGLEGMGRNVEHLHSWDTMAYCIPTSNEGLEGAF